MAPSELEFGSACPLEPQGDQRPETTEPVRLEASCHVSLRQEEVRYHCFFVEYHLIDRQAGTELWQFRVNQIPQMLKIRKLF